MGGALGNAKQGVGKALDNEQMQAEGAMQEAKGKGQGMVGEAKDNLDDAREALREEDKEHA